MSVCYPTCSPPSYYSSFCDISAISSRNDYIYLYGVKFGQTIADWSLQASNSFEPGGMIYSVKAHFLYYFSHSSSSLYLTIVNNWTSSKAGSDIQISVTPNPSSFTERIIEIDQIASSSLLLIGNNPVGPS